MPLRWRLVGLYALILAAVLALFSVALTHGMRRSLVDALDRELEMRARSVAAEVEFEDGRWFVEPASGIPEDYRADARRYFLVADASGTVMARSPLAESIAFPAAAASRELLLGAARYREVSLERVPDEQRAGVPATFRVACGASLAQVDGAIDSIVAQLWIVAPVVLALSMLGGFWLVSRALRPIGAIARTAEQINAENLARRIEVSGHDELGRLARTLNGTFARLQAAFAREQRFTADASHELRTPLAVIAGNAELAQSRPRTAEELRDLFADVGAATARMQATIEGLLTLARADAGAAALARERVSLAAVAEEAVRMQRTLADGRGVALACAPQDAGLVDGDPERLQELVANLVTNAIRYTRRGGRVTVRVRASAAGHVELEVEDTGIGIGAEDLPRIFERFFRADPARARDGNGAEAGGSGAGLGLAIAKWIAEAHGGSIRVTSEVGAGSLFVVTLPAPER